MSEGIKTFLINAMGNVPCLKFTHAEVTLLQHIYISVYKYIYMYIYIYMNCERV